MTPQAVLVLPQLHPLQSKVRDDDAQYQVIPWGRRCGKSRLLGAVALGTAWPGGRVWWIFPSHPMARPGWQTLRDAGLQLVRQGAPIKIREAERALLFPETGGEILIRSADDPRSLVGEGLDVALLDECGLHKDQTWDESIRPTLLDRGGRAIFAGVPKGTKGLLYSAHLRAVAGEDGWREFHATTFDNPLLPKTEMDRLRAEHESGQIPSRYWRQEYLAEFLPADGEVFRNVLDCATATERDGPTDGKSYVVGVDWGKRHDWTVFSVWCLDDRCQVYIDRFRGVEYGMARSRLAALAETWHPAEIVAEENAMGDPICEDLERMGLPIRRFLTTAASKTQAVDALALAFEQRSVSILADPAQVAEFQAFEATTLPSGRTRYAAPTGTASHDDTVMAAVMAWSAVSTDSGGAFWGP